MQVISQECIVLRFPVCFMQLCDAGIARDKHETGLMLSWSADQFKHLEVQVALVNTQGKMLQLRQELSAYFCLVDFLFTQLLFLQLKRWLVLLSHEVVCAKQTVCPLPGTVHVLKACQLYIPLILKFCSSFSWSAQVKKFRSQVSTCRSSAAV